MWSAINTLFLSALYFLLPQMSLNIVLMVLIPLIYVLFILLPSTHVLFILAREVMVKDNIPTMIIKAYTKYLSSNYKPTVIAGTIYLSVYLMVYINFNLLNISNYIGQSFFFLFSLLYLVTAINYFMLTANYTNKLKITLINSIILTLSKPKLTIKLIAILTVFIIVSIFVPILILFTSSMLAYFLFYVFINEMPEPT